MSDVVVFGEALIRLSTGLGTPFQQAQSFAYHIGGAELNLAVNLRALGKTTSFVTVLPEGDIGDAVLGRINDKGVDTKWVKRADGSMGVYFLERAAAPRTYRVLKRQAGVIAQVPKLDFNWSEILKGSKYLFATGITAALSPVCLSEIKKAVATARTMGVKTVFDFNYRSKMWSQAEAKKAYVEIVKDVDVLFGSATDLKEFLGLDAQKDKLPWPQVVLSERNDEQQYSVHYLSNGQKHQSRFFSYQNIDRVGVGDAMAAGFLYADINGYDAKKTADFAAAAGAVKYSIEGDWNLTDVKTIEQVMAPPLGGIVR